MKNFKLIILVSIILAIIISIVSFWVDEFEWAFISYLALAGCFLVWVQKENQAHKFLSKLIAGSAIFGSLLMILNFLRMYALTHLIYDSPIPFSELWDKDRLMIGLVFIFVTFLGGLLGIVLKGFYTLYKNKLNKAIIFIGPLLVLFSSLSIYKIKIGGTIMSSLHGWPYPFLIHQIKDVLDGFIIDKWIFNPGSLWHYIICDYLLYLLIFALAYLAINFINQKLKAKKINTTLFLFGLLILLILIFTSFLPAKKSHISYQISRAGECNQDFDCEIVANRAPFGCAIVVNKENTNRIMSLINSFPSTGKLSDSCGNTKAACLNHKCWVTFTQTTSPDSLSDVKKQLMDCLPKSDTASWDICQQLLKRIQSFDDCVEAGLFIMKSNPPQCALPDGRTFAEVVNNDWNMIVEAIENCQVTSVMQTHNLEVTAVLKTGEIIKTIEPKIDDVFETVGQFKEKCGEIRMATE